MTIEAVLVVMKTVSLAVNITTMFLTLPAKHKLRFSVAMFMAYAAVVIVITNMAGAMNNALFASLNGLFYLPVVIFLFHGQFFQKVFAFFLQLQFTAWLISLGGEMVAMTIGYDGAYAPAVLLILLLLLIGGYMTAVVLFGRRVFKKLFIQGRTVEWALYAFGAIFTFAIVIAARLSEVGGWLYIAMLVFALWSFAILCYAIINTHEKAKQKYDAEFAQGIISTGSVYYQKTNAMHETIRVLHHDYKYHMKAIRELVTAGDTERIKQYLTEMEANIPESELHNYCKNPVINALIASYAERCANQDIRFDVDIMTLDTLQAPNYELCIVIGNLLENAVEACEKLSAGRAIRLAAKSTSAEFIFMVTNSFNGAVRQAEGSSLPASDKSSGGMGLRSVEAVAVRYGGDLLIEWNEDAFTAYVTVKV